MTRYTPLPSEVIRNNSLNDRHFRTYCLIMEKCWNPDSGSFEWSAPSSMSALAQEMGRPRTTLLEHIKALVAENVLQIHYYSENAFSIIPTATVGQPTKLSVNRPITINTSSIKKNDSSDKEEEDVGQPTPVGEPTVDAEIVNFLRLEGVGEPMRSRIAASGKSFDYVKAWFDYVALKDNPISHALVAIRDDLPAPEFCSLCHGIDGNHRGLIDEDGHFTSCPREDDATLTAGEIFRQYGELRTIEF